MSDLRRRAMMARASGGGNEIKATVDVVFDNLSRAELSIPFDYQRDNYAIKYEVIATGVYTDGVLTMDDTPTIPVNQNIPLTGLRTELSSHVGFTGYIGTNYTSNGDDVCSAYVVVRLSKSTYVLPWIATQPVYDNGYVKMKSYFSFGKTGYYYKYRVTIWAWDDGTELSLSTVNAT